MNRISVPCIYGEGQVGHVLYNGHTFSYPSGAALTKQDHVRLAKGYSEPALNDVLYAYKMLPHTEVVWIPLQYAITNWENDNGFTVAT